MKVTKWVEFEKEVEIEISGQDAMAALLDTGDDDEPLDRRLKRVVNSTGTFLRAIPDDKILQVLNEHVRKTIGTFFRDQAPRFWPIPRIEDRAAHWVVKTLGENCMTPRARALRFLEEAHEMAQACGLDLTDCKNIAYMVYSKPVGELAQELGGCGTTLAALAASLNLSVADATEAEMTRIENLPAETFQKREYANAVLGIGVEPSVKAQ